MSFFDGKYGLARSTGLSIWKNRRFSYMTDKVYDLRLRFGKNYKQLVRTTPTVDSLRILVVGVATESRPEMMQMVMHSLRSKVHNVTHKSCFVEGRGKLANTNRLLANVNLPSYDWIIMVDDDIVVEPNFIDLFIEICRRCKFAIAMPAHNFSSYMGYEITRRNWATLARSTHFVEIGPLVAFRRDAVPYVFPLPELKFGWGVDVHWSAIAAQNGWTMGVVDATPIRHTRPIGKSYPRQNAIAEGEHFLTEHEHFSREATFCETRRHSA